MRKDLTAHHRRIEQSGVVLHREHLLSYLEALSAKAFTLSAGDHVYELWVVAALLCPLRNSYSFVSEPIKQALTPITVTGLFFNLDERVQLHLNDIKDCFY